MSHPAWGAWIETSHRIKCCIVNTILSHRAG